MALKGTALSEKFLQRPYNVWFNLQNILKMTGLEMENKLVVVSIWEGWRERDENDYKGLAGGNSQGSVSDDKSKAR